MKTAYADQIRALIAGGSDILLVETIFDSLNAKAALVAIQEVFEQDGKDSADHDFRRRRSRRRNDDFRADHRGVLECDEACEAVAIGLNCSLGPDLMRPFLAELAEKSNTAISCYPNAGLPNPLSPTGFDLKPEDMGNFLGDFAKSGLINIAGGCCGNTPEHIAAIAKALEGQPPRTMPRTTTRRESPRELDRNQSTRHASSGDDSHFVCPVRSRSRSRSGRSS